MGAVEGEGAVEGKEALEGEGPVEVKGAAAGPISDLGASLRQGSHATERVATCQREANMSLEC